MFWSPMSENSLRNDSHGQQNFAGGLLSRGRTSAWIRRLILVHDRHGVGQPGFSHRWLGSGFCSRRRIGAGCLPALDSSTTALGPAFLRDFFYLVPIAALGCPWWGGIAQGACCRRPGAFSCNGRIIGGSEIRSVIPSLNATASLRRHLRHHVELVCRRFGGSPVLEKNWRAPTHPVDRARRQWPDPLRNRSL